LQKEGEYIVKITRVLAVIAALSLVAAACGDDTGSTTTAAPTTTGAPTTTQAVVTGEWCSGGGSPDEASSTAGAGDNLLIFQWQGASQANALLSSGTKDLLAGSLVLEPLIEVAPDGSLLPKLAVEVPTTGNGGVSEDGMTVTYHLKDCIVWSDGTPFTAADVQFSYEFCADTATGCSGEPPTALVGVEATDDLTVVATYDSPQPFPYEIFTGFTGVIIQKAQFEECIGAAAVGCSEQNFAPIGTGPYMVTELRPEDVVLYAFNPLYRMAADGKPFFSTVEIKGGGDAESAARSVLEIGEGDYAWNLQVAPEILNPMEAAGLGRVVTSFTANVEHLNLNWTNPDADPPSEYGADMSGANPFFFENELLHNALSIAIDREEITTIGYGATGQPTCNIWPVGAESSPNNDDLCTYDAALANQMLDDAGYLDSDGDGIRNMPDGGANLSWDLTTSTNAVRQTHQELLKAQWALIDVNINLLNEDAGLFFDGTCASDFCIWKFFTDIQMYTNGATLPDGPSYLSGYRISDIPTAANSWGGNNIVRFYSEEFDAELATLQAMSLDDPGRNAQIHLVNDLVVRSAVIPMIHRGNVSGISNTITGFGDPNGWSSEYWNIEEWARG
jgi:peptide/nickel transport system substrate-binding protein